MIGLVRRIGTDKRPCDSLWLDCLRPLEVTQPLERLILCRVQIESDHVGAVSRSTPHTDRSGLSLREAPAALADDAACCAVSRFCRWDERAMCPRSHSGSVGDPGSAQSGGVGFVRIAWRVRTPHRTLALWMSDQTARADPCPVLPAAAAQDQIAEHWDAVETSDPRLAMISSGHLRTVGAAFHSVPRFWKTLPCSGCKTVLTGERCAWPSPSESMPIFSNSS